jgi:hypothetical protein
MHDSRRGFGLVIGFIGHFNTKFITTLNYGTIANVHTLQSTGAHAKSFPARCVFSRCLVTMAIPLLPCSSSLSEPSQQESDLLYDWRFTANQFILAPIP